MGDCSVRASGSLSSRGSTGGKVDSTPRFPGIWESSGIIDVKPLFRKGRRLVFLLDVQAHSSAPPGGATETVEGGQLLLLRGNSKSVGG